MSYTAEQHEKNKFYIDSQMADCSSEDRGSVIHACNMSWADDDQCKALVKKKKEEIAKRATPDEIDEVFKNFRV